LINEKADKIQIEKYIPIPSANYLFIDNEQELLTEY
jgi:hypothetical protein